MLPDVGATGVLLGHSERRQYFGETDEDLAAKVPAALAAGLSVILCVGETRGRARGGPDRAAADARSSRRRCGTSTPPASTTSPSPTSPCGRSARAAPPRPELAQAAHAHLRGLLEARYDVVAHTVRLLYGGSVKPDNAAGLLAQPDIDGGLVGGASLEAESLLAIARAAAG